MKKDKEIAEYQGWNNLHLSHRCIRRDMEKHLAFYRCFIVGKNKYKKQPVGPEKFTVRYKTFKELKGATFS